MTNQPFSWEEAAKKILANKVACGERLYINMGRFCQADELHPKCKIKVIEALTALNQAFKQAVDAAEPETYNIFQPGIITKAKAEGFNDGKAQFKSNLYKLIGEDTE